MSKTTWIITDGKKGTENQCLGLASSLGLTPTVFQIKARFPWSLLPPIFWFFPLIGIKGLPKKEPWPQVLIAASRSASAVAAKIRQLSQGKTLTIFLQNPHLSPEKFDIVIAPSHDQLKGPNVIETLGCLHPVTPKILEQAYKEHDSLLGAMNPKKVAILLGGKTRHYQMPVPLLETYATQLRLLAEKNPISYMLTASRRTETKCLEAFRKGLGETLKFIWDEKGPNPYLGILAHADIILVTADSVSMISEAIATGKPVYILTLKGFSKKLGRFHKDLLEKGIIRFFEGSLESWSYKIPLQTKDIIGRIKALGSHY